MAHYATSCIVVNLGCEMLYVIEQRLNAQGIPLDKSNKVISELTTLLFHTKLLDELFLPQPVASHNNVKELMRNLSSSSIMKLDEYSMNKLWNLITMITKWQISATRRTQSQNQNIFDITRRHLKSVASMLPQNYLRTNISKAMKKFDEISDCLNNQAYQELVDSLLSWFSKYNCKISVLLRLGLQKEDGYLVLSNDDIKLGENLYILDSKKNCQNISIDNKNHTNVLSETNEIKCLLGYLTEPSSSQDSVMKLEFLNSLIDANESKQTKHIKSSFDKLETLVNESKPTVIKSTCLKLETQVKDRTPDLNFSPMPNLNLTDCLIEMLDIDY